jgi:hypothetical protein
MQEQKRKRCSFTTKKVTRHGDGGGLTLTSSGKRENKRVQGKNDGAVYVAR